MKYTVQLMARYVLLHPVDLPQISSVTILKTLVLVGINAANEKYFSVFNSRETNVMARYASLLLVDLLQIYRRSKFKDSIPCGC